MKVVMVMKVTVEKTIIIMTNEATWGNDGDCNHKETKTSVMSLYLWKW